MPSSLSRKRPRESAVCKRFFKLMSEGFEQKIDIPEGFTRYLTEEEQSMEFAILNAEGGSYSRKVKIQKGKNDSRLYFKAGWEEFVIRHRLKLWDFVVFEHKGGMVFDTLLFGASSCEKDFSFATRSTEKGEVNSTKFHDKVRPQYRKGTKKARNFHGSTDKPSFQITISESNGKKSKPYLNIPRLFLKAYDLYGTDKAILKDPSGKCWEVMLYVSPGKTYAYFCNGWYEFYASNNLKTGDLCTFELTRLEVGKRIDFDVHITRSQEVSS